mmetsp:Transcript_37058/g.105954  ORF Transcript_37058/g.105954 Transcript_37058/m.105954 type:complete len:295 (+) Transcript_37058:484-1368(+)
MFGGSMFSLPRAVCRPSAEWRREQSSVRTGASTPGVAVPIPTCGGAVAVSTSKPLATGSMSWSTMGSTGVARSLSPRAMGVRRPAYAFRKPVSIDTSSAVVLRTSVFASSLKRRSVCNMADWICRNCSLHVWSFLSKALAACVSILEVGSGAHLGCVRAVAEQPVAPTSTASGGLSHGLVGDGRDVMPHHGRLFGCDARGGGAGGDRRDSGTRAGWTRSGRVSFGERLQAETRSADMSSRSFGDTLKVEIRSEDSNSRSFGLGEVLYVETRSEDIRSRAFRSGDTSGVLLSLSV